MELGNKNNKGTGGRGGETRTWGLKSLLKKKKEKGKVGGCGCWLDVIWRRPTIAARWREGKERVPPKGEYNVQSGPCECRSGFEFKCPPKKDADAGVGVDAGAGRPCGAVRCAALHCGIRTGTRPFSPAGANKAAKAAGSIGHHLTLPWAGWMLDAGWLTWAAGSSRWARVCVRVCVCACVRVCRLLAAPRSQRFLPPSNHIPRARKHRVRGVGARQRCRRSSHVRR